MSFRDLSKKNPEPHVDTPAQAVLLLLPTGHEDERGARGDAEA